MVVVVTVVIIIIMQTKIIDYSKLHIAGGEQVKNILQKYMNRMYVIIIICVKLAGLKTKLGPTFKAYQQTKKYG